MLQYETCSPSNELCAMMECFHPKSTVLERAQVCQLNKLVALLSQSATSNGTHRIATPTIPDSSKGHMAMDVDEMGY